MPYLTTEAAAADRICRRFSVPVNKLPQFMGALYALAEPMNWEQFGTLTPDEEAAIYFDIIDSYIEGCMIGTIFPFISAAAPAGALALDGSTYDDADYPELAAALDAAFDNGDGTFTLPDLRGRVIVGAGTGAGLSTYAVGDTVGEEAHTLIVDEMPEHAHSYDQIASTLIDPGVAPSVIGIDDINSVNTGTAGAGDPHENRQPSLALNYAVWYR